MPLIRCFAAFDTRKSHTPELFFCAISFIRQLRAVAATLMPDSRC